MIKRKFKFQNSIGLFVMVSLFLVSSNISFAATEVVDGITWTYTITSGKATIGTGAYSGQAIPSSVSGDIVVPSTLGQCPVVAIASNAFRQRANITSVIIPTGVTSIGEDAFVYCTRLKSVTIPEGVTRIEWSTFSYCYALQNVTLPAGVAYIGCWAFSDCNSLTNITIPASTTEIHNWAFSGCKLRSFNVDENNANPYLFAG